MTTKSSTPCVLAWPVSDREVLFLQMKHPYAGDSRVPSLATTSSRMLVVDITECSDSYFVYNFIVYYSAKLVKKREIN